MAKKHITGVVTNSAGATAPFSGDIDITEVPVISSVTVTPQSAPAGTVRLIRIVAADPQGLPLAYVCLVDGVPAAPTANVGEFTWNS